MHTPGNSDGLETGNCPSCGGGEWRPAVRTQDPDAAPPRPEFSVVRCAACGLCFTNPRPTAEAIGKYYAADYQPYQIARPKKTRLSDLKNHLSACFPFF